MFSFTINLQVDNDLPISTLVPRLVDKLRFYNPTSLEIDKDTILFSNGILSFAFGNSPFSRFNKGKITLLKRDDNVVEIEAELSFKTLAIAWGTLIIAASVVVIQSKQFVVLPAIFTVLFLNGLFFVLKFRWFLRGSIKRIKKEFEKEKSQTEALYFVSDTQKEWMADSTKCPACGFSIKPSDTICPDCGLNL